MGATMEYSAVAGSGRAKDVDVTRHVSPDWSDPFYLRSRLLPSVTVRRRKSWLLAASALVSSLGISGPALAANECGPLVGGSVICTSTGNSYPNGIVYGLPHRPRSTRP